MEELNWSQARLANALQVSEGRVSQILNNPGNLSLGLMVKCVRAMRMKLSVVAYNDGDEENLRGPIDSEIFRLCWENCSKPSNFWQVGNSTSLQFSPMILTQGVAIPGIAIPGAGCYVRTELPDGLFWAENFAFASVRITENQTCGTKTKILVDKEAA